MSSSSSSALITSHVQKWLDTLPLTSVLASGFNTHICLNTIDDHTQQTHINPTNTESDSHDKSAQASATLEALAQLSDQHMDAALEAGWVLLKAQVKHAAQQLRACLQQQRRQKEDSRYKKYCEEVRAMSCGSVKDFHAGLVGRVGMPDLNFVEAMRAEHCTRYGHDVQFTSSNYSITTTPHHEWSLVMTPEEPRTEHEMKHDRRLPDIGELMRSAEATKAGLIEAEVIALVLYTGPMYTRYNTMLRRYPTDVFEQFQSHNNMYTTTIFVLVSAVQKIARHTAIAPGTLLYRGLGGKNTLPERFTSGDDDYNKAKGFTEWGFMSTTAKRSVAVQYSGAKDGRPQAMIMEMEPNTVDRGACISSFSQYCGEEEYLWVPCSFIQPLRDAVLEIVPEGLVTVLRVHVNANIRADTVEELLQRKRTMHIKAFSCIVDELTPSLTLLAEQGDAEARLTWDKTFAGYEDTHTVQWLVKSIVDECEARLDKHRQQHTQAFVDDAMFREMVQEMMDVQLWARHMLMLWLNDRSNTIFNVQGYDLQLSHRQWLGYVQRQMRTASEAQERKKWAVQYLQARGLIKQQVDETSVEGEARVMQGAADGWSTHDMKAVVAAGADVNYVDELGRSPVFMAAQNGHVECVSVLVAAGADVNKTRIDDVSPVYMAAENGHVECVSLLVAAGADVNKTADDDVSPVYMAAYKGHVECVSVLVAAGADVNKTRNNGVSPVFMAAQNGHVECVSVLVAAGADVDKTAYDDTSPVYMAAQLGHVECVSVLVAAGADVNKTADNGVSPVYRAAQNGHVECVSLLVAAGADVNKTRNDGVSPVFMAAYNGHVECVRVLHSHSADLTHKWKDMTPLDAAIMNSHQACVDLLTSLV